MINFTIKTLDSVNHEFSVDDETTVAQLKERIRLEMGIEICNQRLIFCGNFLSDDSKLSESINGKVIHLVPRPPPSPRLRRHAGNVSSDLSDELDDARRIIDSLVRPLPSIRQLLGGSGYLPPNQPPDHSSEQDVDSENQQMLSSVTRRFEFIQRVFEEIRHSMLAISYTQYRFRTTSGADSSRMREPSPPESMDVDADLEFPFEVPPDADRTNLSDAAAAGPSQHQPTRNENEGMTSEAMSEPPQPHCCRHGHPIRQSHLSGIGPRDLAALVDELDVLRVQFEPHRATYLRILRDTNNEQLSLVEAAHRQAIFELCSDVLHSMAHAYHCISDLDIHISRHTTRLTPWFAAPARSTSPSPESQGARQQRSARGPSNAARNSSLSQDGITLYSSGLNESPLAAIFRRANNFSTSMPVVPVATSTQENRDSQPQSPDITSRLPARVTAQSFFGNSATASSSQAQPQAKTHELQQANAQQLANAQQQPKAQPHVKAQPQATAQPQQQPEAEPQPEAQPKPQEQGQSQPKPQTQSQPKPEAQAQPQAQAHTAQNQAQAQPQAQAHTAQNQAQSDPPRILMDIENLVRSLAQSHPNVDVVMTMEEVHAPDFVNNDLPRTRYEWADVSANESDGSFSEREPFMTVRVIPFGPNNVSAHNSANPPNDGGNDANAGTGSNDTGSGGVRMGAPGLGALPRFNVPGFTSSLNVTSDGAPFTPEDGVTTYAPAGITLQPDNGVFIASGNPADAGNDLMQSMLNSFFRLPTPGNTATPTINTATTATNSNASNHIASIPALSGSHITMLNNAQQSMSSLFETPLSVHSHIADNIANSIANEIEDRIEEGSTDYNPEDWRFASVQELPHVIYLGNIPVENVAAEERAGQSAGRNTGATRRTPIAGLDREGNTSRSERRSNRTSSRAHPSASASSVYDRYLNCTSVHGRRRVEHQRNHHIEQERRRSVVPAAVSIYRLEQRNGRFSTRHMACLMRLLTSSVSPEAALNGFLITVARMLFLERQSSNSPSGIPREFVVIRLHMMDYLLRVIGVVTQTNGSFDRIATVIFRQNEAFFARINEYATINHPDPVMVLRNWLRFRLPCVVACIMNDHCSEALVSETYHTLTRFYMDLCDLGVTLCTEGLEGFLRLHTAYFDHLTEDFDSSSQEWLRLLARENLRRFQYAFERQAIDGFGYYNQRNHREVPVSTPPLPPPRSDSSDTYDSLPSMSFPTISSLSSTASASPIPEQECSDNTTRPFIQPIPSIVVDDINMAFEGSTTRSAVHHSGYKRKIQTDQSGQSPQSGPCSVHAQITQAIQGGQAAQTGARPQDKYDRPTTHHEIPVSTPPLPPTRSDSPDTYDSLPSMSIPTISSLSSTASASSIPEQECSDNPIRSFIPTIPSIDDKSIASESSTTRSKVTFNSAPTTPQHCTTGVPQKEQTVQSGQSSQSELSSKNAQITQAIQGGQAAQTGARPQDKYGRLRTRHEIPVSTPPPRPARIDSPDIYDSLPSMSIATMNPASEQEYNDNSIRSVIPPIPSIVVDDRSIASESSTTRSKVTFNSAPTTPQHCTTGVPQKEQTVQSGQSSQSELSSKNAQITQAIQGGQAAQTGARPQDKYGRLCTRHEIPVSTPPPRPARIDSPDIYDSLPSMSIATMNPASEQEYNDNSIRSVIPPIPSIVVDDRSIASESSTTRSTVKFKSAPTTLEHCTTGVPQKGQTDQSGQSPQSGPSSSGTLPQTETFQDAESSQQAYLNESESCAENNSGYAGQSGIVSQSGSRRRAAECLFSDSQSQSSKSSPNVGEPEEVNLPPSADLPHSMQMQWNEQWMPVFAQDQQQQSESDQPQEPYSDAYLLGMPSRKRRCIRSAYPEATFDSVIDESVRESTSNSQPFDITDMRDRMLDSVRTIVRTRSEASEDYDPVRYPATAKFLDHPIESTSTETDESDSETTE